MDPAQPAAYTGLVCLDYFVRLYTIRGRTHKITVYIAFAVLSRLYVIPDVWQIWCSSSTSGLTNATMLHVLRSLFSLPPS